MVFFGEWILYKAIRKNDIKKYYRRTYKHQGNKGHVRRYVKSSLKFFLVRNPGSLF